MSLGYKLRISYFIYFILSFYPFFEITYRLLGLSGAVVIITQISKDLSDTERSGSKRVRLVPPSEAHDRVLEEKREMEEQLPETKASSSACLEEEDEKFFDAEDDGITQPRQTTEAVVTKKYYIFNP